MILLFVMIKHQKISESTKKFVAGRQHFKCANKPNSNLDKLETYQCPLWANDTEHKGSFDESGYAIDHKKQKREFCVAFNKNSYQITDQGLTEYNDMSNLQSLCLYCKTVKTNNVMYSNTRRNQDKSQLNKFCAISNNDDIDNDANSLDEEDVELCEEIIRKKEKQNKRLKKQLIALQKNAK